MLDSKKDKISSNKNKVLSAGVVKGFRPNFSKVHICCCIFKLYLASTRTTLQVRQVAGAAEPSIRINLHTPMNPDIT